MLNWKNSNLTMLNWRKLKITCNLTYDQIGKPWELLISKIDQIGTVWAQLVLILPKTNVEQTRHLLYLWIVFFFWPHRLFDYWCEVFTDAHQVGALPWVVRKLSFWFIIIVSERKLSIVHRLSVNLVPDSSWVKYHFPINEMQPHIHHHLKTNLDWFVLPANTKSIRSI